jgi:ArsR family transcriptional regulator
MKLITYFKALSDETRLRLFNLVLKHELNVNEIVAAMGMGQSRISRHLKILTESGLLTSRRDGLWVFYKAVEDDDQNSVKKFLLDAVKSDPELLDDINKLEKVILERSEEKVKYFDSIADNLPSIKKGILGNLNLSEKIALNMPVCSVAADLGCGTGDLVPYLSEKAGKVIGVDKSPGMLEEARERFAGMNGKIDFRIGSIEHLPMRDNETDCAVINMVLHYLPYPNEVISETSRVLKKGGTLLITELEKHTVEEMRAEYGHRWLGFSSDEMSRMLKKSGFSSVKKEAFNAEKGLKINLFVSIKD